MLAKELIAQVRRLEIRTRRIVDEMMGGAYHSRFKGRGMEFDEVREYSPGDDVRDIDWNVTARMGTPYLKKYVEERELHVLLAVDFSASLHFGSTLKDKHRTAAEIGALLALSAIRNNDKVGMVTFTDRIENYLPPRSGRSHALRLIRDMVGAEPVGTQTDIAGLLVHLRRILRRRTVVFLITDMLQPSADWERPLRMLSRRHDVVIVNISDPAEHQWLAAGRWNLADAETAARFTWNAGTSNRTRFANHADARMETLQLTAAKAKAGFIDIRCGDDPVDPLIRYFSRQKRR